VEVRRLWPDIVDRVKLIRRVTWMHLSQQAQVVAVDEKTLTLGFKTQGARDNFATGGHEDILRQAVIDAIGQDWRIETIVDPSAQPGAAPYSGGPAVSTPSVAPAAPSVDPTAVAKVSDGDASPDDLDADDDLGGAELLQRELGAHIIEEIKHD
jgi:DNA polymerase-3 subunit gamma/tau